MQPIRPHTSFGRFGQSGPSTVVNKQLSCRRLLSFQKFAISFLRWVDRITGPQDSDGGLEAGEQSLLSLAPKLNSIRAICKKLVPNGAAQTLRPMMICWNPPPPCWGGLRFVTAGACSQIALEWTWHYLGDVTTL
jgi:hypothetical protein